MAITVLKHSMSATPLALAAAVLLNAGAALAEEHAPAPHGTEAEETGPSRTDLLALGPFRIRGCRTTDQEIFDIRFGLNLVLSAKTTPGDFHQLEQWKNRIRDQVIIAVRSAEPEDFAEPELRRVQRLILFRVKRLATGVGIIGVYLTDFSLDEGDTLEDLLAPPVTPAPPKKAAGGGH